MQKRTNIPIGKWIKHLLFILLFLFVPFYLNQYIVPTFKLIPSPVLVPEKSAEIPEDPKQIPVPSQKKQKQKKPVEIETQPLSIPPIQTFSLTKEIDSFRIASEMEALRSQLPPAYKAKKIYIPPVEYKMNPKDLILPAGMIALGAIASHSEKYRDFIPGMRKNPQDQLTPFDDIAQLVVSPSLFVLDIFAQEKHHPVDQFFLMAVSYGITVLPVRGLKNNYEAVRPYGGKNSFPSGHTATAFVGAHMIYKEFKDSNPWVAYSGYAMASVVAGARVGNDKHWVCDVVAGAGIAMLSTELAYLIYFPVRNLLTNEINKFTDKYILLVPAVYPEAVGFHLSLRF